MALKFNNDKKDKKRINVKVIATSVVAITLIGIVGISIGRYSKGALIDKGVVLDITSTVEKGLNDGFIYVKNGVSSIFKYRENARKAKELESENEDLKKEIIELKDKIESTQSLQDLKRSLNFIDEKYKANMVSASVVGKNDDNWYTSFVIGAGKKQGVQKDSIVVNGKGLVGIVYEVSENYSKAISLLDTKSSVSFKLLKNPDYKGVITQNAQENQNYKSKGLLEGYMFDSSYDVIPGDVLLTSGLGLYPESIPIGEIEKVIDDKNKGLKYVVVKPYADFKNIDDVVVIQPRNIK